MDDQPKAEGGIADEFRNLGQNIIETLRAAWDSPERKKVQEEIEDGLDQLARTIRQESEAFVSSPTGQQLKSDLQDLNERVRSGEAEAKVREEVLKALRTINAELKKVTINWEQPQQTQDSGTGEPPAPQV